MGDGGARLADHYIRAYGLRAIVIATCDGKPIISTTGNLDARRRQLRHQFGRSLEIVDVWWCASAAQAEAIAGHATATGSVDGARDLVASTADRAGAMIAPHQVVVERAREAVAAIRAELADMNSRGDLRSLNAAYRARRLRRAKLGLTTEPYAAYLRRHAIRMLYTMAGEIRLKAAG